MNNKLYLFSTDT